MVGQSKIRTIGIIGLGSIGLRHAKNLMEMGHKVFGYDPEAKKATDNGIHWCAIEAMFGVCDGIVIASPTYLHADHIHECLLAEKPFFVEKPIKNLYNDREGIEALMVGYNLRFHSCVKKAKEWIEAGFLGQPQWANFTVAQFNDRPDYLYDGVILNWSHEIDLALYLLGPGSVAASSTRLSDGRDDVSDILITHKTGCRSAIHLDYITRPEIRQSIIVGSDATIIFDLVHREAWLRSSQELMLDHHGIDDSFDENYIEEMEAFIDRIDGKETLGCTGSEALDVLKICLEVRKQAGL